MKIAGWVAGAVAVFLTVFMFATAGWDRPPIGDDQTGYRGTGMVDVVNPRERSERGSPTARRSRGLKSSSPPPWRAATVISRMSFENIWPRFWSFAAFFRLILDHLL